MSQWAGIAGLGVVLLCAALLLGVSLVRGRRRAVFRDIPAFRQLTRAVRRAVEDGSRLHVSLGHAALTTPQSASALAGLALLRRLAKLTSAGDKPPIATSGDASLSLLSQDTLQSAAPVPENAVFDNTGGRLTGLTPFSYAVGAIPVIRDEGISTNVLMGNLGVEAALLTDAGERGDSFVLAGSDSLTGQAVIYATAQEPLIGEELFAAGGYVEPGRMQSASLTVQDILRGLVILAILAGVILGLAGML